jgi:hypothetical protein
VTIGGKCHSFGNIVAFNRQLNGQAAAFLLCLKKASNSSLI